MYRQSEKMLNNNISSTYPYNMTNFGPLTAETRSGVWGTLQILTGFASCLHYCSDVTHDHRRSTKLCSCTMFGRILGGTLYIHFRGFLPPDGILSGVKFTLRPSLAFSYIGSVGLLHGTPAAGVSQALRCGTRNRITELSERAPPIFGWAAITLGI